MDAIQFLKTVGQICKTNNEKCDKCPLNKCPCIAYINCMVDTEQDKDIEEMVKIADRWAKEHQDKTRQSEFLKMFPNATINESDGILCVTPCNIEGKEFCCAKGKSCGDCRRKYWLTEVTDNGNIY